MKVLWLSHFVPYPPRTGALQRSYHLLRQVAQRHEVHLVALNQSALLAGRDDIDEARRELSRFCASTTIVPFLAGSSTLGKLAVAGAAAATGTPYEMMWVRSARFSRAVRLHGAAPFDLVHADTIGLMPYAQRLGAPVVLNHHNVESHMLGVRAEHESSALKRAYFRTEARRLARVECRLCAAAHRNLVVSELDGERLREICGHLPLDVVPNGVDVDYFDPQPAGSQRGMIFAGGMGWYPNRDAVLWFLAEIWPALVAERPDRSVEILGRDAPPELHRMAAQDPRFRVPGFVPDVRPHIDRALLYVCPIRNGGGTRLKVLDALAMAKPLVATAFAVEGLGMEPERHYLRAETPADYVRQITRLEDDPTLRERLARAGRRLVQERFAWDIVGARLDDAYRGALTAAAPSASTPPRLSTVGA